MSTTRSQRLATAVRQSGSQWRPSGCFGMTMIRSRFGMRVNTPSATGPQATVMRAAGWARIR